MKADATTEDKPANLPTGQANTSYEYQGGIEIVEILLVEALVVFACFSIEHPAEVAAGANFPRFTHR